MEKYNPNSKNIRKCYKKVAPNKIEYKYLEKPIINFNKKNTRERY